MTGREAILAIDGRPAREALEYFSRACHSEFARAVGNAASIAKRQSAMVAHGGRSSDITRTVAPRARATSLLHPGTRLGGMLAKANAFHIVRTGPYSRAVEPSGRLGGLFDAYQSGGDSGIADPARRRLLYIGAATRRGLRGRDLQRLRDALAAASPAVPPRPVFDIVQENVSEKIHRWILGSIRRSAERAEKAGRMLA